MEKNYKNIWRNTKLKLKEKSDYKKYIDILLEDENENKNNA